VTDPVDEAVLRARVSLLLLAAAVLVPPSHVDAGPVVCPVRRATGRPCPGCGASRALVRLLHGDVRGAARQHPVSPVLGLLLLAWAAGGARTAGTPLDPRRWRLSPAVVAALALWLAWALRRALR
jgi:hypothetical protein